MPTERHDSTDEVLRSRFHELGAHLERSLDAPADIAQVPHEGARRAPATRGLLVPVAAALVLVVSAGAWLAVRGSDRHDRVVASSGSPTDSAPDENATPSSDDPWPPPAEVHEHCVEDEATRSLYAEGDYPSEATRAQHCEARFHDLPQLVVTPEGVPPGVVSSAALRDQTASDEFQALLEGQGFNSNDLAIQSAYQELWGAISNRHAAPVFDRDGEQIGWFGGGYEPDQGGFVSMEDMPRARAEAERVIAEFERTGALPGSTPRIESLEDVHPSVTASEASVGEVFDGETRELVMDGEGVTRGWIATAEEKSQQVLMIEHARDFDEALSRADGPLGRRPILEAIAALHPIEVRDEAGELTGYWILGFVEIEDYEAMRVQAEEYLATLG